ncbi:hypothetical protein F4802DRAFT_82687 [Xylaria palmicola]|nr:hypothetical protein F4802DRAFT_82687 [Xylaria palmicola]
MALVPSDDSRFAPQTSDGDTEIDLGSASDRSVSMSSQSTYSLKSGRGSARASGDRARRDATDVRRVLRTMEQVKHGTYRVKKGGPGGKYLVQRTLHYSGYKLLLAELEKAENQELLHYVNDKLRFDYTHRPCKGEKQFVIHLSSAFHGAVAGEFSDMIVGWLHDIEQGRLGTLESCKGETARVASAIRSTRSKTVECNELCGDRLEPDFSFTYRGCRTAGLLVEVAWSQSRLNLPDRAARYIQGMRGEIRTVVGLDMKDIYYGGCRASFSIWRAEHDGEKWRPTAVVDNQEFLDGNGEAVNGCKLTLSLRDFICARKAAKLREFEDVPLEIPSTKLYELFKQAFVDQIMDEATDEIEEVRERVDAVSDKILGIEKIMQERWAKDGQTRTVTGKEELIYLRNTMSEAEDEIGKIRSAMEGIEMKMDRAGSRVEEMDEVAENRAKVTDRVAGLETRLANARVQEEGMGEGEIDKVEGAFGIGQFS